MARKRSASRQQARPELLSLLEACKDQPEDDAPRLILADWLEENGDEHDRARAEFVRLQLVRANLDDDDPLYEDVNRREYELIDLHGEDWVGPLAEILEPDPWAWIDSHRRGLFRMSARADDLLAADREGLAATEAWAWVDSLSIETPLGAAHDRLQGSPLLAGLTGLSLRGGEVQALASLLGSPVLGRLLALSLRGCKMRLAADLVAGSPQLTALALLDLWDNPIGDAGAKRLATAAHLGRLRDLSLDQCNIGPPGAAALGRSDVLAGLENLDLTSNPGLGGLGIAELLCAGRPRALKGLRLGGTEAGEEGAAALAAAPQLAELRELILNECAIGDRGIAALAGSPHLRRLETGSTPGNREKGSG